MASGARPQDGILGKVGVKERFQGCGVTQGCHPANRLAGMPEHKIWGGPADLGQPMLPGNHFYIDLRCSAGQDQQGSAVALKDKTVGDGADIAAQHGRCCRGRGHGIGNHHNGVPEPRCHKRGAHVGDNGIFN